MFWRDKNPKQTQLKKRKRLPLQKPKTLSVGHMFKSQHEWLCDRLLVYKYFRDYWNLDRPMTSTALGNLVFIQTKPGFTKIEITKRLSDALEVLGIIRYILLIDVYVAEFLGKRPTTTPGSILAKFQCKKPTPHFPILEPLGLATWNLNHSRNSSRSFQSDETEIQYQVLHAYVERIHELYTQEPWVLLVECSFQTKFDYVGLEQLSEKFDFGIHWLPIGTKGAMNAKFQSIVAQILTRKDSTKNKSKIKLINSSVRLSVQTLHKNLEGFGVEGGKDSICTFDTLDVVLCSPPFFNAAVGKHYGRDSSAYTSCEDTSEDEDSQSEIDFEDEVLGATMDFSKRLPSPDLHRYISIANDNQSNNIAQLAPVFVVLVRDIFPGPASHISSLLKDTLKRKGIKCKRLVVSTLFVQPKSIEIMKHFAVTQNSADFKSRLSNGCSSLLINILHFKLSQDHRAPIVIIVDLEDERYVRLFPILDFCAKISQKVLVLEKRPDGTFEQNFNRVYAELKKGCIEVCGNKRIRKLKLPKYNLTFIKEFLPFNESSMKLGLEEDQESVALLRFMSSDLSHLIPTDSIPTSLASSMGVPRVDLNGNENENDLPVDDATIPKPTAPVGQQIINFIFQKTKSLTTFTPSQVSISNGISKTRVALQGTFGISALKAVFKRRSIFKSQESELQNNQNIQKTPEVVEGSSRGYDSEGSWETVVEVDENLNEVRNPLTATFAEGNSRIPNHELPEKSVQPAAVVTDDEPSNNMPERSLNFPSPSVMCKEMEDYVPGRTRPGCVLAEDEYGQYPRQSLIQICRLPQKKRRKIEKSWPASDTSEESLFKGWVGIPRDVVRKKKPGVISRLLTRLQSRFRTFILGPIRNAFRFKTRTNRITPSQLIRRDWRRPLNSPRNLTRYRRMSGFTTPPQPAATSNKGQDPAAVKKNQDPCTPIRQRHGQRAAVVSA